MRTLIWTIPRRVGVGTNVSTVYRLDQDYIPVRAWVQPKSAIGGKTPLIVDINVDGSSIFSLRPTMIANDTDIEEDAFASVQLSKDSVVTLDIDQGDAVEMTVGLELDEA